MGPRFAEPVARDLRGGEAPQLHRCARWTGAFRAARGRQRDHLGADQIRLRLKRRLDVTLQIDARPGRSSVLNIVNYTVGPCEVFGAFWR